MTGVQTCALPISRRGRAAGAGGEQDLPPEYRDMQRPLSLRETHIKHSILSHPELIDPEDQKNLRRVADPYAELTSPEEAT